MEQAMTPLKGQYGLHTTSTIRPDSMRPKSLDSNTTLNTHPPMVIPKRSPETIMFSILGSDEQEMTNFLSAYQKNQPEWDVFRKKIPQELLNKFKKVMEECHAEGYVNPKVQDGNIIWRQILTRVRNKDYADQCTLCPNSLAAGTCKGRMRHTNQRLFVPCWGV